MELNLASGSQVGSLTLNGVCSVLGDGEISQATVNVPGCSFQNVPANVVNNSGSPLVAVQPAVGNITLGNFEKNNTFGGFKFTTSQVVTADELAGKIKAGSIVAGSIEQRGANNGKEWKGVFSGVAANQSYPISCLAPFTMSGSTSLSWSNDAPPVAGLSASYSDGNIHAYFSKADGENQRVSSYRVFVVKSGSSLNLTGANNASSSCYTSVNRTNSSYDILIALGSNDSDGNAISAGNTYSVHVLTVADGVNAKTNCLTGPSNTVDIPAAGAPGGPADNTPPVFAGGYPNMSGVTHRQAVLNAMTNESGAVYYVLLADGAVAPSVTQVRNAQDSTGAAAFKSGNFALAANTAASGTITGLAAGTDYDIYVVARDSSSNLQAAVTKLEIHTSDTPAAAIPTKAEFTNDGSISITFSKDIDPLKVSIAGAYIVTGSTVTVTSVSRADGNANKIKLSINPKGPAEGWKISYVQPADAADQLMDTDGVAIASFGPNNVEANPPVLQAAVTQDATHILLTFDKKLYSGNFAAMASAFTVKVGESANTVTDVSQPDSGVEDYQKKIILVLTDSISSGQSVTVSYSKPGDTDDRLKSADQKLEVKKFDPFTVINNLT